MKKVFLLFILISTIQQGFTQESINNLSTLIAGTIWHSVVGTGVNKAETILRFNRSNSICAMISLEGGFATTSVTNYSYKMEGDIIAFKSLENANYTFTLEITDNNTIKSSDGKQVFQKIAPFSFVGKSWEVKSTYPGGAHAEAVYSFSEDGKCEFIVSGTGRQLTTYNLDYTEDNNTALIYDKNIDANNPMFKVLVSKNEDIIIVYDLFNKSNEPSILTRTKK